MRGWRKSSRNAQQCVLRRTTELGLTRRGDLKTKLAAYEAGVDDILTVPFAPEELLARIIALVRRAYTGAVTFTPVPADLHRQQSDCPSVLKRADR